MIFRSFPLPGAHDLVSVAGAELSYPYPPQQKQSVDGRWGRRRWCGDRSPRSMGEGQGRGECPLVLAFMVCPAHAESSPGGSESPLPALAFHSLRVWQVVKPEDRGGPEQDLARGSLSSGIRVSLISGTALGPYSRHMWVFSPCWSSRPTLSHITPETPFQRLNCTHTHTPFLTYQAPSDTHLQRHASPNTHAFRVSQDHSAHMSQVPQGHGHVLPCIRTGPMRTPGTVSTNTRVCSGLCS